MFLKYSKPQASFVCSNEQTFKSFCMHATNNVGSAYVSCIIQVVVVAGALIGMVI